MSSLHRLRAVSALEDFISVAGLEPFAPMLPPQLVWRQMGKLIERTPFGKLNIRTGNLMTFAAGKLGPDHFGYCARLQELAVGADLNLPTGIIQLKAMPFEERIEIGNRVVAGR